MQYVRNVFLPLDENPLAPKDISRKFLTFYMGVENMGDLLKCEAFWLPVATLRLTKQNQVVGACSASFCAVLRKAFTASNSFAEGVPVFLDVGTRLLFAKYVGHLADESALHAMLCVKGAGGTR